MMTRKHFESIASVLRAQTDNLRTLRVISELAGPQGTALVQGKAVTLSTTAYNLAQVFAGENENFDHLRFYEAAGFVVVDNHPYVFEDETSLIATAYVG